MRPVWGINFETMGDNCLAYLSGRYFRYFVSKQNIILKDENDEAKPFNLARGLGCLARRADW